MATEKTAGEDVLVISDDKGNLYLIRRETLEGGRIVDKAKAEKWMGNPEVAGFAQGPSYQVVKTFKVPTTPKPTRSIVDSLRNL